MLHLERTCLALLKKKMQGSVVYTADIVLCTVKVCHLRQACKGGKP